MSPSDTLRISCIAVVNGDCNFAMLKAYFDESGIHGDSSICVVAGFALSASRAWSLSTDWQNSLLFKYRIPYFHAKEFAQRRGPFEGWSNNKIRDFSIDAIGIINISLSTLKSEAIIAAALTSKDFMQLSIDERRWLTGGQYVLSENTNTKKWKKQGAPTKPYFLLFQQAVLDAVKVTQDKNFQGDGLGTGEIVHFIFDQQHEYESSARAVFRAMKQMPISVKDRIGDVVFSSKLRAIPLQVADFIAYESFCYLNRREVDSVDVITNQAERLFNSAWWNRCRSVFIDKTVLQQLLSHCPLQPRQRFIPPDPR
jgi:Protein of unknown function (DUF3800)